MVPFPGMNVQNSWYMEREKGRKRCRRRFISVSEVHRKNAQDLRHVFKRLVDQNLANHSYVLRILIPTDVFEDQTS